MSGGVAKRGRTTRGSVTDEAASLARDPDVGTVTYEAASLAREPFETE